MRPAGERISRWAQFRRRHPVVHKILQWFRRLRRYPGYVRERRADAEWAREIERRQR